MGLRDTIQKAAATAIAAVGDIATTPTYVSVDDSNYDPTLNVVIVRGTSQVISLGMIFSDYKSDQIDGESIRQFDEQALIPANNLTVTTQPKEGDRLHKTTTDQWKVVSVKGDAAGALWILQVRKTDIVNVVAV